MKCSISYGDSTRWTLLAIIIASGSSAWAECGCFCVGGDPRTLCTTVGEAQADPHLCPLAMSNSCPTHIDPAVARTYSAPESEATNCRDVDVYDPVRGAYMTARACDVL